MVFGDHIYYLWLSFHFSHVVVVLFGLLLIRPFFFFVFTGRICAGAWTHWSHYQHCVRRQNNPQEPHHKKTSYAKGKKIARSWIKWRGFDAFDFLIINLQWSVINNVTWALLSAKKILMLVGTAPYGLYMYCDSANYLFIYWVINYHMFLIWMMSMTSLSYKK